MSKLNKIVFVILACIGVRYRQLSAVQLYYVVQCTVLSHVCLQPVVSREIAALHRETELADFVS